LGRPKAATESSQAQLKQARCQQRQDELNRIPIEGEFGQGGQRFALDCIMARLVATSAAVILVSFIVVNLERPLSQVLLFVLAVCRLLRTILTDVVSTA